MAHKLHPSRHRKNVSELSSQQRQRLRQLLDTYIATQDPVGEHLRAGNDMSLHIHGHGFLAWHTVFIAKLEQWLVLNGGGEFVPLPYYDPDLPIPPELSRSNTQPQPPVPLGCLLALGGSSISEFCHAQTIIDLDATTRTQANAFKMTLPAGSWTVTPVDTSGGGSFTAWNAWGVVTGCAPDGSACSTGWIHAFSYASASLGERGAAAEGRYATPELAFQKARPVTLVLSVEEEVAFWIGDSVYPDNLGGVSLSIAADCAVLPRSDCRQAGSRGGKLQVADRSADKRDVVVFHWTRGAATTADEFGAPTDGTEYTFCLYDGGGLRLAITVPAGGTCAGKPCWKHTRAGFRYKDNHARRGTGCRAQGRRRREGEGNARRERDASQPPDASAPRSGQRAARRGRGSLLRGGLQPADEEPAGGLPRKVGLTLMGFTGSSGSNFKSGAEGSRTPDL